jgi:hypothetical protein
MEQSPWEANRVSASQEIPAIYATQRLTTAFTSARHLPLSWASAIQSMLPQPASWRSILFLVRSIFHALIRSTSAFFVIYILCIRFNIILSIRSPNHNPVRTFPFSHKMQMPLASHSWQK